MGKTGNKSTITFKYSNDVLAKMYNTIIRRTYNLLYSIKLSTKLLKVFCCRQTRIYEDDISEAKCLPFSQVETLPLGSLKE